MAIYSGVRRFYTSLQRMVGLRRRKRQLQISEPFNFRKEATVLPGLSEEEMSAFREKAAVSRLGIAHTHAGAYNDTSTSQHCCRSPQSRTMSGSLALAPFGSTVAPVNPVTNTRFWCSSRFPTWYRFVIDAEQEYHHHGCGSSAAGGEEGVHVDERSLRSIAVWEYLLGGILTFITYFP